MQSTQAQGKPSASQVTLHSIDAGVAHRLGQATYTGHRPAVLKERLWTGEWDDCILAVINILFCFNLHVKGSIVRDYVVRGLVPTGSPLHIDLECMYVAPSEWHSRATYWQAQIKRGFGLTMTPPELDPGSDIVRFDINVPRIGKVMLKIEFPTWNMRGLPPPNMDACNSLRLEPGAPLGELRLEPRITTTVEEIVSQLLNRPKRHAIPARYCEKKQGGTDGVNQNMTVQGTTDRMQDRFDKVHAKGYHVVEAPHVVGNGNTRITLYHGTSVAAAAEIVANGFNASAKGRLGPGVYMSADMNMARKYAEKRRQHGAIISAEVDAGKVITMQDFDDSGSWQTRGYDSAFLPQCYSKRSEPMEEWCIVNPSRIHMPKRVQ